jgi:hypothetical protein
MGTANNVIANIFVLGRLINGLIHYLIERRATFAALPSFIVNATAVPSAHSLAAPCLRAVKYSSYHQLRGNSATPRNFPRAEAEVKSQSCCPGGNVCSSQNLRRRTPSARYGMSHNYCPGPKQNALPPEVPSLAIREACLASRYGNLRSPLANDSSG